MRPRKVTDEIDARLERIADLKAQIPNFKDLAEETGLTESYLRQLISRKVQIRTNKCYEQT